MPMRQRRAISCATTNRPMVTPFKLSDRLEINVRWPYACISLERLLANIGLKAYMFSGPKGLASS
jgi:hypothetical protein